LHRLAIAIDSVKLKEQLNVKESFFNDAFVVDDYSTLIPMYCKTGKNYSPPNFHNIKINKLNKQKGVFIKHEQPGILKNYKAETKEEKAYFKTQYLKMNNGYHFSFLAVIEEDLNTDKPVFMSFGGENSTFNVAVRIDGIPDTAVFNNLKGEGNVFHFISDTILKKSDFENVVQFIGETQHFRPMRTDAKNNLRGLYNLNRDITNFKNVFSQSNLLIKKGSIAFIDPVKIVEFKEAIDSVDFEPYKKIGYNYYKQIKKF
jgi:hypothetical protein